uniref:Uncharacterized protein n=1 Tax=Romanomermis culicivorax TaxID=13658 RepID=A0A915HPX4_ROMCU
MKQVGWEAAGHSQVNIFQDIITNIELQTVDVMLHDRIVVTGYVQGIGRGKDSLFTGDSSQNF